MHSIIIFHVIQQAIALDGHVIMFEHGYGSLTVLLTRSMHDSTGQFIKQKSHHVDKRLPLKLLV